MGLRSRLKSKVKSALGRSESPSSTSSSASSAPPPARAGAPKVPPPNGVAPTSTATPKPTVVPAPKAPAASQAKAAAPKAAAPKAAAPEGELSEEAKKQAKIAKHREKTRRAVLKKLDELGGESQLAALHDYSERRYFVAHRAFSEMMEGLVAEELLLFDHSTGVATLTQAGRDYGAS